MKERAEKKRCSKFAPIVSIRGSSKNRKNRLAIVLRLLREFDVSYKPNTVTEVTGVTDFMHGVQDSPLFNYGTKSDAPHQKTVTPVTSVTDNEA